MNKQIVRIVSNLFPKLITSFAYKKLTNPQVRKLRQNERITLEKATKEKIIFKNFEIQLYTWQGGKKEVLLVHGWEGQAGNFSDLIEALLKNGYTVHAFDGPSHGFSSKGQTSLFEFTELVAVLIRKYQVKLLISHSFGGVATTFGLYNNKDLKINKYIMITTPDKFIERIDDVVESVGIGKNVKDLLIQKLQKETGLEVKRLNVSEFVKSINVKKALIIHDINDKVIPITRSRNVHNNWSISQFQEVEGTGHFRILRTKEVSEIVMNFLE
ncbi:MAG: alpha/beta hydrolase [Bacteroidota bacterium]